MWRWYLNSERAAFQLKMEDSRKGKRDGEKELSTLSPHVDDEKGKKVIVYKTKKGEGKGGRLNNHISRACPKRLMVKNYAHSSSLFYTKIQYLSPKFRLAFSPALYKFIILATWTWIHHYFGFKSNLVLTSSIVFFSCLFLIPFLWPSHAIYHDLSTIFAIHM